MLAVFITIIIMGLIVFAAARIILGWILPSALMARFDRVGHTAATFLLKLIIVATAALIIFAVWSGSRAQNRVFTVVDAVDLGVGTKKYIGKDLEVHNIRCYYADVDDYRCMTDAMVVIFTKKIQPEVVRRWFETNCDTLRKVTTGPNCSTKIRFNYQETTQDIVNGFQLRTIIKPESITAALPNAARRTH